MRNGGARRSLPARSDRFVLKKCAGTEARHPPILEKRFAIGHTDIYNISIEIAATLHCVNAFPEFFRKQRREVLVCCDRGYVSSLKKSGNKSYLLLTNVCLEDALRDIKELHDSYLSTIFWNSP